VALDIEEIPRGGPPQLAYSREQLDVVLRVFDDTRALIAAQKLQRWDVVKWAVTVNIGLAAASAGFKRSGAAFFLCALLIAAFGIGLIFFYNWRLTQTRGRLPLIHKFWRENVIDLKRVAELEFGRVKGIDYDGAEVRLSAVLVGISIFPALLIWGFGV
jgi:hypothetical protein